MAVSDEMFEALVKRLEFAEAVMNKMLSAITKLVSKDQVRQLSNLRQIDITNLETRVTALENAVDIIQELLKL